MVNVRMAQHHGVDPPWIDTLLHVPRVRLRTASLKQAGIEQDPGSRRLDEMHRTGDLARRAPEGETNAWHEEGLSADDHDERVPNSRSPASPSPGRM
jgi:hypothetical protein